MEEIEEMFQQNGGQFLSSAETISNKLSHIKAIIFDWDGVFNTGEKNSGGSSSFSEVDSMGTNLLRFSFFLKNAHLPSTAIISGEKNEDAFFLAKREHFNNSYFKIKHKIDAIRHFCDVNFISPDQIAFFYDDVLDLSAAKHVGLRIFISRKSNPLFNQFVIENELADYITGAESGNFAVREACELLIGLNGNFNQVIQERMDYSKNYHQYIEKRNKEKTTFFTVSENQITEQSI